MRRREFIGGLGSAAAWPRGRSSRRVIGFLRTNSDFDLGLPFLQGLKESGYVEGQNPVSTYMPSFETAARVQR
jgi:hypothetical protein